MGLRSFIRSGFVTGSQIEARFLVDPILGSIKRFEKKRGWVPAGYLTQGSSSNGGGYRIIRFRHWGWPMTIRAHHLIWVWVHGEYPQGELDHINGNRDDNRIVNLRLATVSENRTNKPKQANNKSGFKWVYWCRQSKTWRAEVSYTKDGVKKKLRSSGHETPDAAYEVASNFAKSAHGTFYNHGKLAGRPS